MTFHPRQGGVAIFGFEHPIADMREERAFNPGERPDPELVSDHSDPPELFELEKPLIVGLTVSVERLGQVRRARMLGENVGSFGASYVDPDNIAAEVAAARRLFADRGWPSIDVTRRSIEETAAELMNMLSSRGATNAER